MKLSEIQIPLVLPNDDGIRPAGKPDECFYCGQKVGNPHLPECVILCRKVKVRYSYEIEIEVPWSWNKEDIEFHRNIGSWCADNTINEIEKYKRDNNCCLCHCFKAEVLEIPDALPYRKDKEGTVVP